MNSAAEFWIWLQRAIGAGAATGDILRFYDSPQNLYASGKESWASSGLFSNKELNALSAFSPSQSSEIIKICDENGWHIVTCEDALYPKRLRSIKNFPLVLYVDGDLSMLKTSFSIGIVGTREATEYGKDVAESMAYSLASAGTVIISGGALGVDSYAHSGAIAAGGKTIAFLGSGLGSDYLKSNEQLRAEIARNGAIISEYLPFTEPSKLTFPIRNRLISGFSQGLLVIEAGSGSGSLITAKCAFEQGRDVFAVPGNIWSQGNMGTNNLIRDGVKPIFSPYDILSTYVEKYGKYIDIGKMNNLPNNNNNEKRKKKAVSKKVSKETPVFHEIQTEKKEQKTGFLPDYASANAKKLFSVMTELPQTADELVESSALQIYEILSALTELEMYEAVQMHSGKRYSKII